MFWGEKKLIYIPMTRRNKMAVRILKLPIRHFNPPLKPKWSNLQNDTSGAIPTQVRLFVPGKPTKTILFLQRNPVMAFLVTATNSGQGLPI